mgnify:CR=1 FL=1
MPREIIEIGGKRYVLDSSGRGEFVVPKSTLDHLEAQKPTTKDLVPGQVPEYSAEWRRSQSKLEKRLPYTKGGCQNTPCPRRSKPGRFYCSDKCMNQWANLRRNRRRRGLTRYITLFRGAPIHFERKFPGTLAMAKRLFIEHISEGVCQFRGEDDYCPSTHNHYADPSKPRCLIYAVFADDYLLWQVRVMGHPALRRYTTSDGRWKERSAQQHNDTSERPEAIPSGITS